MSIPTITVPALTAPIGEALPQVPELGTCDDCGLGLVCLVEDSAAVFCESCDLGIPSAKSADRSRAGALPFWLD
ncbi:hypothetical protein OG235_36745 [Streptomyces sp. NBC_00024]|uniref:hypothetical protein n=1 Tax=Streptomyces sp. NBC_00024 TaxID=2903612 RepID=UPI00325485DF